MTTTPASETTSVDVRVDRLVQAFRMRGHLAADTGPLRRVRGEDPPQAPELTPAFHGLPDDTVSTEDLDALVHRLRRAWCGPLSVQLAHIDDVEARRWVVERMEAPRDPDDAGARRRVLEQLTASEVFDRYLQKKFTASKTFSLEGCDVLVPLIERAVETTARDGGRDVVLGMAHRGRLSVLVNVLGMPAREVFDVFLRERDGAEDVAAWRGRGDVAYHRGRATSRETDDGGSLALHLCSNPSHLEFVGPVALGRLRARLDARGDGATGLALLVHGDAAFPGEGVAAETLNLGGLDAYGTDGSLHVVLDNAIGYTTPAEQGRTAHRAADLARMLQTPVFHADADQPDAVMRGVDLALAFRRAYRRDVVLELRGYRRRGHNEGDEPAFTQPLRTEEIEGHPTVREFQAARLEREGVLDRGDADALVEEAEGRLDEEWDAARDGDEVAAPPQAPDTEERTPDTAVPADRLAGLLRAQTELPDGFTPHPVIERAVSRRREMVEGERPLDWSAAEALAFASLATDGVAVRLTGQDAARGTFSQRHAVLHDVEDGETFVPLLALGSDQAPVAVRNSPLSEAAVLGFEYGYSLDAPDALVLWEAQFGDFVNAGQVIVDQYLATAEDKWGLRSGLTLLLPHGWDGQGPEHSSARLERFLTLAAEDALRVAQPSTPAQLFHLLRRQATCRPRRPLVVLTPKSMLRDPRVVSPIEDCANGRFEPVLADPDVDAPSRVLLCSGKIAWELRTRRDELERDDVAVVRLEQLAPFPVRAFEHALAAIPEDVPLTWVQEEPVNMGAWPDLARRLVDPSCARMPATCVARRESASPATGSKAAHAVEQADLLDRALA